MELVQEMNYDIMAFLIFVFLLSLLIYKRRKKLAIEKILYPVLYIILYRTNFGIKFMKRFAKKFRSIIILIGYCFIGLGFVGLVVISVAILKTMFQFMLAPKTTATGMWLIYPGTNIPGIGYLSFWYWIIGLFIIALVHEFAHGIVASAHGLKIKSSGFAVLGIFVPIFPAAFVEPDEKELSKRPDVQQYSTYAAGPVINLLLALLIFALLPYVADASNTKLAPFETTITEPVGFTFDVTNTTMPAAQVGLYTGVLINRVGNESVTNADKFVESLYFCTKSGQNISIGNENKTYVITTTVSPSDSSRGYIGVENLKNVRVVKPEYKRIAGIFYWFKELFKWLFLLNFFIGLANLLPIFVTDGAKILQLAISNSMKNKEKAIKIWKFANALFLFLIVIGLLSSYLRRLF